VPGGDVLLFAASIAAAVRVDKNHRMALSPALRSLLQWLVGGAL